MSPLHRYATELSRHPVAAVALGEALGSVVQQIGPAPDVAVVFTAGTASFQMAQIVDAVHTLLSPTVLVVVPTDGLLSPGNQGETESGILIWAGNPGPVKPVRLDPASPSHISSSSHLLVAFGEVPEPTEESPDALGLGPIIAANRRNRLAEVRRERFWLDDQGYQDGAVGFLVPHDRVEVRLAKGFRRLGEPMAVTGFGGGRISDLAGERARSRMDELIDSLSSEERGLAQDGLLLGIVRNEYHETFSDEDFSMVKLIGSNRAGELILDPSSEGDLEVALGSVVQFHVRDPDNTRFDLRGRFPLQHGKTQRESEEEATSSTGGGALVFAVAEYSVPDLRIFAEVGIAATAGTVSHSVVAPAQVREDQGDVGHAGATAVVLFR